ncbi:MAG: DNA polymerase III subunit chi [Brachymonas sp.]|nr:DNA polymerase III subunit chi [Brachymonas sp.]
MTRIDFHFNVPDKLGYICRLVRKAVAQTPSLVVIGPQEQLAQLDVMLWQFAPTAFVGHAWLKDEAAHAQPASQRARVWLAHEPAHAPRHDVLLNLQAAVMAGFEQFERVVEVVGLHDADRQAARERWRHYAARGYAIQRHDFGVSGRQS